MRDFLNAFVAIAALASLAPCGSHATLRAEENVETPIVEEPPLEDSDRDYWAYHPVVRPEVPAVIDAEWCRNPIDRFILVQLEKKDRVYVRAASRRALIRRATFDLTGLPPTTQEIENFLADDQPGAFERVVDRLLKSPHYGERWAQHWLDLVRFAETDGFEHDNLRPEAWRYRDWVIQAFNEDVPYDEFIKLQLAGDEIAPDSRFAQLATGYLLAGPDMPDINLQEERRHVFLNEMTANVGEVFLGLRFGCAQCHHHRTDPISQHDFYRLRSFFETIDLFKEHPLAEGPDEVSKARVTQNTDKTVPASQLWIRGDFRRPGPELSPQFPRVLTATENELELGEVNSGRRTALAAWLTQRDHPLTARVMVNRIWQHHFGRGLVATTSDFGWLGDSATHPELLDWLAAEFMDTGWSMKAMHRLILTSSTYQLASVPDETWSIAEVENWEHSMESDPRNYSLGRMNRIRLEGEAIRDAMLAVSGELNPKAGGPGVRPPLPAAVASTLLKNQWPVTADEVEHTRRSIYLFMRRNLRLPLLESFDKPDANLSCPERSQTTIAPQALHLLNSEFAQDRAQAFANRIQSSASDTSARITLAYNYAFGRPPSDSEIKAATEFLNAEPDTASSWTQFCLALLNLNEFVYLD